MVKLFVRLLSANPFTSCSAVPNTPDRMLSICAIKFEMYSYMTEVGFPTEYCCMVENSFNSRVLAN